MKTAMQEWFDELKANYPYMANEIFDKGFNKYLEKEKKQIVNAYDSGYKACDLDETLEINKTMFSGDIYYNNTYNENK